MLEREFGVFARHQSLTKTFIDVCPDALT